MMKERLLRRIENALVSRRPSWLDRLALSLVGGLRPGVLDTRERFRRHFVDGPRVSLLAASDRDPDLYRRLQGGDVWMKHGLSVALGVAGVVVTDLEPDVVIHLFGGEMEAPRAPVRVLWIHSHPETVTPHLVSQYDRVFCVSHSFAARIREWGFDCGVLLLATSLPPVRAALRYDVVFVGNARNDGRRKIVDDVGTPDFSFSVWGGGYRALPPRYHAGDYCEYFRLPELYASSAIALNDHTPTMAEHGLITPRVFDVLASGGFCISDVNSGLSEVFGDAVPQYRTRGELRELIEFFLANPEAREALRRKGQRIALAHSWSARAGELLERLALPIRASAGNGSLNRTEMPPAAATRTAPAEDSVDGRQK
jgi:hypothetical protein